MRHPVLSICLWFNPRHPAACQHSGIEAAKVAVARQQQRRARRAGGHDCCMYAGCAAIHQEEGGVGAEGSGGQGLGI